MGDSYRRYSGDDDNLASSTRDDARRWRAFVRATRGSADARKRARRADHCVTSNDVTRYADARNTRDVANVDAREMHARGIGYGA